jgi:hypothetical protein
MEWVLNVIMFIEVIVEYMSFFYVIFRKSLCAGSIKRILYTIPVIILLGYLGVINWDVAILNLTGVFTSVFMTKYFFDISVRETVKLYFVAFSSLSFLETIMYYIVETLYNVGNPGTCVIYLLCVIIGLWVYYFVLGRKLDKEAFNMPGIIWLLISIVIFLLALMISYFTFILTEVLHRQGINKGVILITAGGFVVFVLNYFVLYYYNIKQKYIFETSMLETYNEQQKKYFEQLLLKEQDTKQFRHDIISELSQIQSFLEKDEYEKGKEYISEMLMGISQISKASYDVGNEIINTVLNYYLIPLEEKISIKVKGFISNELNISMRDLCIISSNIVKNAVDALEDYSGNAGEIKVEVRQGESFWLMRVKNTMMNNNIILKDGIPVTTKNNSELHGFGIKNIISSVDKYNGEYNYRIENGYYIAEVYLKI